MKIGLQIPSFTWPDGASKIASNLKNIVQTAEEAGFYSIWAMDHFFQINGVGPVENDMLEGYSTLTYIAGLTQKAKLGTLVTGVIYRYPGILVKTATTLDVLSGGRAYFGVGAAWFEREALGLGVPYPPTKERFERLEETLQIANQMWSSNNGAYNGKHYQLAETLCVPQPLTKPHPPIMIGGMGENKTPRLVAQYGDACNYFPRAGLDVVRQRLDTIKQNCDSIGRDYNTIERTGTDTAHLAPGKMSVKDVLDWCKQVADTGIQHLIFNMPNVYEITPLETFGKEIIPAVADW
jgi:F420-dependent oxidoreductase-like protein